jgi:hypothetical protein
MDRWTEGAQRILERSPTRATTLSRILEGLQGEGVEVKGREAWILKRLSEHPELFRVLPDRDGPFHRWPLSPTPEPPTPSPLGRIGNPWVLACPAPPPGFGTSERAVRRMQEALVAWGRSLDRDSPNAVARWIRENLEAEGTCSLILAEGAKQL